ncbi:hypothetical protein DPX16_16467 [Anabarilius grahami]|uniref:Uncharacterized protein n=1 Tax=Anabarilius grahami TaxID=495550 RepID=A0A3N0XXV9_ANAGA|nr:hypothetical protein DPX16_16467 [Anabarilius grahami]
MLSRSSWRGHRRHSRVVHSICGGSLTGNRAGQGSGSGPFTLQTLQQGFPSVQAGGVWEVAGPDPEPGLQGFILQQAGDGKGVLMRGDDLQVPVIGDRVQVRNGRDAGKCSAGAGD